VIHSCYQSYAFHDFACGWNGHEDIINEVRPGYSGEILDLSKCARFAIMVLVEKALYHIPELLVALKVLRKSLANLAGSHYHGVSHTDPLLYPPSDQAPKQLPPANQRHHIKNRRATYPKP
jgi:hypothetical protein